MRLTRPKIDERHDVQEEQNRLQELLPIGLRVCRLGLISFFIIPGWTNGCATISSPKYRGAAKSEVRDRRRVDGAQCRWHELARRRA